jgi:hypothetical protein
MSDEKRQTRLLPFRLRRAGARRANVGGVEDFSADAELTALLREWEAPGQSPEARGRLLEDFRATVRPAPLWRRALTAQVRVPLPVAACALLALLLSPLAFGARPWRRDAPAAPAAAPATPAVQLVEVPVVHERVVTRTVYVEKKERGRGLGVSSQSEAAASPEVGAATARRAEARVPEERQTAGADASAGFFTRVNMEDFQPTNEMKIRVVSRGSANEK